MRLLSYTICHTFPCSCRVPFAQALSFERETRRICNFRAEPPELLLEPRLLPGTCVSITFVLQIRRFSSSLRPFSRWLSRSLAITRARIASLIPFIAKTNRSCEKENNGRWSIRGQQRRASRERRRMREIRRYVTHVPSSVNQSRVRGFSHEIFNDNSTILHAWLPPPHIASHSPPQSSRGIYRVILKTARRFRADQ